MNIQLATLDQCGQEKDTAVVIDVLRAFTTTTFAFAAGAEEIILVAAVEDAFLLSKKIPDALLMGEADGYPVDGFHLSNSPSALLGKDLTGKRIIHRSSAGTQGIVRSAHAKNILAGSLCCVNATVKIIRQISPEQLTIVTTGVFPNNYGDEDVACADMIEARIKGQAINTNSIIQRVQNSKAAQKFKTGDSAFPKEDLILATQLDRFNFAMIVEKSDGLLKLHPVPPEVS